MRKTWQIRGPFGEYLIVRKQDVKSNERTFVEGGSFISIYLDELLAESMSRDVLLELYKVKKNYLLPEIGAMDSSDIGRFIKPQLDEFFKKKDFELFQIARLYISGYRELQEGKIAAPAAKSSEGKKDEATKEAVVTVIKSEDDEEQEKDIVQFVLESESDGFILPFHKFRVFDANDTEIATGETDENGEALIEVPEEADYYIVVDNDDMYSVSGSFYHRDGKTILANASLDIKPWQGDSYSIETDDKGKLELNDVPEGILTISYEDSEYSIYVDSDISGGVFCLPYDKEEDEESTEFDKSDEYEGYELDISEDPDIDPEDF